MPRLGSVLGIPNDHIDSASKMEKRGGAADVQAVGGEVRILGDLGFGLL